MARKNTRAASGAGSIRQRPDGRWEARISVGADSTTGKPVRRSVYGDTQAAVRKEMTAILRELDKGTYQTPSKMKVRDWLTVWMETYCKNKIKPLTYSSYEGIINKHINPMLGGMELQAVKGIHVQKFYNSLVDKGLSGKTVKNVSAVLHKAFSVALKQGYIQTNPCGGAELPKAEHHEIHPLTDEEIPRFLEAIEDNPMRNAFALCLFAGLREGECLGLSWGQVDFQRGRITISQQLQHEKKKGGHLAIMTFYRRFKKIAAAIGRPDARPHDLRHTAATVAIASGADIKSVQDLLGHATASFTLNVYAHTSEKMMKDTAARVQSYYDGLEKMG